MRKVINGAGVDTTNLVLTLLQSGQPLFITDLFEISTAPYQNTGTPSAIRGFFVSPRDFPLVNRQVIDPGTGTPATFMPSVIERTQLSFELGLDTKSVQVKWSPDPSLQYAFGLNLSGVTPTTGNLYWQFQRGGFDNGCMRIWRAFMPSDGDADTLGLAQLFIGRIADVTAGSDQIEITANTFSEIFDQQVPRYLIEAAQRSNQLSKLSEGNSFGVSPGDGDSAASTLNSATVTAFVATHPHTNFLFPDHSLAGNYAVYAGVGLREIADNWNDGVKNYLVFYKGQADLKMPYPAPPQQIVLWGSLSPAATAAPIGGGYIFLPGFPFIPRPEDQF